MKNVTPLPPRHSLRVLLATFAALLITLVLGLGGPALAVANDGPNGNGSASGSAADHANSNSETQGQSADHAASAPKNDAPQTNGSTTQKSQTTSTASTTQGPDHSAGNASTTGNYNTPQPPSRADQNTGGANGKCTGGSTAGPYCSTRDGSPSMNGNGGGKATGKPCAGCVGKADNKNPKGQYPGGSDHNAGYECDTNHGIGRSNPAHTGCTTPSENPPSGCPEGSTMDNGTCVVPPQTCPTGSTPMGDQCVITSPPQGCPTGSTMDNGTCVVPPQTCPTGSAPMGGQCVTTSPPQTCPTGSAPMGDQCVVTSPPSECTGDMSGVSSQSAVCGTDTLAPVIHAVAGNGTGTAPQAGGPSVATAAPVAAASAAPAGVLPNTGAPANVLLLLVGALAMLGCGAWVVRRQLG